MGKTRSERISELLKTTGISAMDLASVLKKQPASVYRIIQGKNEPTTTTLRQISQATNANFEWLLVGTGEMFNAGGPKFRTTDTVKPETVNPYKDAMIMELKEQVEFLKNVVYNLSGGKPTTNFLELFEETRLLKVA